MYWDTASYTCTCITIIKTAYIQNVTYFLKQPSITPIIVSQTSPWKDSTVINTPVHAIMVQ